MVFYQDFVDKVKLRVYAAKKKLFPNTWGCVGEMNNVHFRNIIISQWVLLSITLIVSVVLAASFGSVIDLASPGEGALASIFVLFPAYAGIGVAVIGMIASGFGTSIYTSANQDGPDMPVKKALFTFSTLLYIFVLLGAVGYTCTFALVIPYFIILLVVFICLLVLALVTLIMRTCCVWNKNEREWMEKTIVEDTTDNEKTSSEEVNA